MQSRRYLTLMVLCLGSLMIAVDIMIVGVAIPSMNRDLHFSASGVIWLVQSYLLTYGSCLLIGGSLGDVWGHRRIFLVGTAVFTAASLLGGLSINRELLLVARAAQGVGGALYQSMTVVLITRSFTDRS